MKAIQQKHVLRAWTLLVVAIPNVALASFADVSELHPNFEAVSFVESEGFVHGHPNGTFRPDTTINRAEFSKIASAIYWSRIPEEMKVTMGQSLCALLDNPDVSADLLPFSDVSPSAWYAWPVCEARGYNIISGYPDGTFRPAHPINFVEAAKMLVKAFHIPEGEGRTWYEPYVSALDSRSAIPDGIRTNNHLVTRGEMAEMIYRLYQYETNRDETTTTNELSMEPTDVLLNGASVLTMDMIPRSIAVSSDAILGCWGEFIGARLSPDGSWLAVGIAGAAHSCGWLYSMRMHHMHPVVFSYGGGVDIENWSADSQSLTFIITTPKPDMYHRTIDTQDLPEYPRVPKEECKCWDKQYNACLPASACY